MKIVISQIAICPGCHTPRMHTVDIYTGVDEDAVRSDVLSHYLRTHKISMDVIT